MSWIIRAMPKLDIFAPLREPEVGDRVRILPWEGRSVNITYQDVLDVGGPEGTVTNKLNTDDFGLLVTVKLPKWPFSVKIEHAQVIGLA